MDRVFGRARLRVITGEHVEVWREGAREGEERRYTKRFLETASGDFRPWTEREWRILDRLGARGDAAVARVVRFFPADDTGMPRLQTRDAGPTVDQWAALVPLRRTAPVLPYVFGDCANWWALARQCLIAFEPLHALGFVHLDFKADNVCLPCKPQQSARPVAGQPMTPDFEHLALIDVAFSLLPGIDLPGALPLAREAGFEYQSPRLLEALDEGRRGDLRATLELDWRADFFSLAALLWRYLPEIDEAAGTGWTHERHDAATAFVRQLLEIHGAPLGAERPHRELIELAALRLAEPQLAAALQAGSRFDPERAWPNGAEATPLTHVAATPVAPRGERIEPRFAMPAAGVEPASAGAFERSEPSSVPANEPAPSAFVPAAAATPVVDDEVAPIGARADVPVDVEVDLPLDVALDVPLEAAAAHAVDITVGEAVTLDLGAGGAFARGGDALFARKINATPVERVEAPRGEPVPGNAPSPLAATVGGPPSTRPVRATSLDTHAPTPIVAHATREGERTWRTLPEPSRRDSGNVEAAPQADVLALSDSTPATAPADITDAGEGASLRTPNRPRAPASSPLPILAAAGAGAIVVALAAWWQLDGHARFGPGAQRADAPASASIAVVPVVPQAATTNEEPAPSPRATPQIAAAASATADATAAQAAAAPAGTAEPSAASPAATTTTAPPASAAALEASAADWMRNRVPALAQAAQRRLAPVLSAAARSPELRRRSEIRAAAQSARAVIALPAGVTVDAHEATRLDRAAQAAMRSEHDVAAALRLQTQ
ncbi:MAG: hypothetical protein JO090_04645, partial [Rhizobacter sp.]|nr:hypothetical protein [Rhizobacter sp.]